MIAAKPAPAITYPNPSRVFEMTDTVLISLNDNVFSDWVDLFRRVIVESVIEIRVPVSATEPSGEGKYLVTSKYLPFRIAHSEVPSARLRINAR